MVVKARKRNEDVAQLAPKSLTLNECDREELEKLLNRRSTSQQIAQRAKIILLADKGSNNREIGRELNISRYMARRWRNRWLESRCAVSTNMRSKPDKAQQWWYFFEHPEVPPDNNLAERSLRASCHLRGKERGGDRSMERFQDTAYLLTVVQT